MICKHCNLRLDISETKLVIVDTVGRYNIYSEVCSRCLNDL